jgi:hypothetical protein
VWLKWMIGIHWSEPDWRRQSDNRSEPSGRGIALSERTTPFVIQSEAQRSRRIP